MTGFLKTAALAGMIGVEEDSKMPRGAGGHLVFSSAWGAPEGIDALRPSTVAHCLLDIGLLIGEVDVVQAVYASFCV